MPVAFRQKCFHEGRAGSRRAESSSVNRRLAMFVLACLLLPASVRAHPPTPGQYDVEAAFLVNFESFVRWPATAGSASSRVYAICILGKSPFGGAFEPFQKARGNRSPLVVRSIAAVDEVPGNCNVLYIARSESTSVTTTLRQLGRSPILTVSDLDDFAINGGIIQFFVKDDRVRFDINRGAASRARIRIDSRLLALAETAPAGKGGGLQ